MWQAGKLIVAHFHCRRLKREALWYIQRKRLASAEIAAPRLAMKCAGTIKPKINLHDRAVVRWNRPSHHPDPISTGMNDAFDLVECLIMS
jgi:hypothetical protein